MLFVKTEKLKHKFVRRDDQGEIRDEILALDDVNIEVGKGQFVAVLGHNGSGKSTFAKHLNALLMPTEGSIWVGGKDTAEEENLWDIRQSAGMIFQNPDNQIVSGVVEEDVAFGPENIGVPTEEIWQRVSESLEAVGMTAYRYHSPNRLSGGQKQRVAIAGVVAMEPKCIVMDEPTAMLDPTGRRDVLNTVHRLNRQKGVTVILITHYMEEVIDADQVFVMDNGHVVMQGSPREIFSRVDTLLQYGLDVPQITRLSWELKQAGLPLPDGILSRHELVAAIRDVVKSAGILTDADRQKWAIPVDEKNPGIAVESAEIPENMEGASSDAADSAPSLPGTHSAESCSAGDSDGCRVPHSTGSEGADIAGDPNAYAIKIEDLSYTYARGSAYEIHALENINLEIPGGQFVGIIGHTGSGKSTLIQLLDGLIKTDRGKIYFGGEDIYGSGYSLRALRGKVGLVFQYPEYQLFETTVLRDAAYGPKNQGCSEEEAEARAREALRRVKLPEKYWEMSPFELSGGQKRRAAIAGVVAMNPKVLILDEPTAGLDPRGRDELFALIGELHEELGMTILLVSHSMEDVARYVDRIVVLNHGKLMLDGTPAEVFSHAKELEQVSLAVPQVTYLMKDMEQAGFPVRTSVTTIEEAKEEILKLC